MSYVLLTCSANYPELVDLIFSNNGASASATGVSLSGARGVTLRCVFHDLRGFGLATSSEANVVECEAYACNQSNTSNLAGFSVGNATTLVRCISHDNVGSNSSGFQMSAVASLDNCIGDTNGQAGLNYSSAGQCLTVVNCDFYNNVTDGIRLANSGSLSVYIENCNFIKNGTGGTGYGVNGTGAGARMGRLINCGFGSGTQANTTGTTNAIKSIVESGSITYATDVTPWVDPANGDFRINRATAINAGRGGYTQTAVSYAGTIGYPDIGGVQHLEAAAGGGGKILSSSIIQGDD